MIEFCSISCHRGSTAPVVLLLCLNLLLLVGCGGRPSIATESVTTTREAPKKLQVEIASASRQSLGMQAQFTGNLLPRRRTLLVAEVDGVIKDIADVGPSIELDIDGKHYSEQLGILPGQAVRAGEILVRLDRTAFELEVAVARAKLAKARADLAKLRAWERPEELQRLRAMLAESEARFKLASTDYERLASLADSAAVSPSDLDRAAMELASSQATVEGHQAALRRAEAGPRPEELAVEEALLAQAEAELRQKERLLAKTTISAPYDGVVTEMHVEEGDHVSTSSGPLLELLDLRYLVAEVSVPEAHLGMIRLQDRAEVSIAGSVEPVLGLVVGINDKVDPESRSFRVRVALDNLEGRFKAGQFAGVNLTLGEQRLTTTVPSEAITFIEGQPGVFVYDRGVVRRRSVTLGISDETHTEILSGIDPGAAIVVNDPNLVTDGMPVDVRNNDRS